MTSIVVDALEHFDPELVCTLLLEVLNDGLYLTCVPATTLFRGVYWLFPGVCLLGISQDGSL